MHSPTDLELRAIFDRTRTIAVLGAHTDPYKPAHYVPEYLHAAGYTVLPVNPLFAGRLLWGQPCVSRLDELRVAVDLVDVFRRPDALPEHIPELLAMNPRPPLVWLQLGIRHAEFARALRAAGIAVIEDRCTLADHRRLGVPTRA